jgi:hypothetical protein
LGFAAVGGVADSMHDAAPDEQPWIESRVDWQSVFLPQAASCFLQALSMHLPQSVVPSGGDEGAAAAVLSELGLAAPDVSAAADDADSAGAALSEAAGASELADAELSAEGLSAGLDSPPPHASQASGTATMQKREAMGRARLMVFNFVPRSRIESQQEMRPPTNARAAPAVNDAILRAWALSCPGRPRK